MLNITILIAEEHFSFTSKITCMFAHNIVYTSILFVIAAPEKKKFILCGTELDDRYGGLSINFSVYNIKSGEKKTLSSCTENKKQRRECGN